MAKWIEKQERYGYSKRLDPMPVGPYIEVPQHRSKHFFGSYLQTEHAYSYELNMRVGNEYYVVALDGAPMMVAAYYDSGD